jgi:hypothetical protein
LTTLTPASNPTSIARSAAALKPSAIAGIVVGSAIGGIAATMLLVFVFRRYRRSAPSPPLPYESDDSYNILLWPRRPSPTELPTMPRELAAKLNMPELPAVLYGTR